MEYPQTYSITINGKSKSIPASFVSQSIKDKLLIKDLKKQKDDEILRVMDEICLKGVPYSSHPDDAKIVNDAFDRRSQIIDVLEGKPAGGIETATETVSSTMVLESVGSKGSKVDSKKRR